MGFGQSKKKESLESVQLDKRSRSRSRAIAKPTANYNQAHQENVKQCLCHTKTVRPSNGKPESKATITVQEETAKHSSNGDSSTPFPKELTNQGIKDVKKTNQFSNYQGEPQPRQNGGNFSDSGTPRFGKSDKPRSTTLSILELPGNQRQYFNERRQALSRQHNLKQQQTKLSQCSTQQNLHQDKKLPTALLQQQVPPQDNTPLVQSQAQQQQQQPSQQQQQQHQQEKLQEEKPKKKGKQQEKLPTQHPVDQQRVDDNLSKKTKKLTKKEQRALDLKQKQGGDLQQPNENQLQQHSQELNHTALPEQNARQGEEESNQQPTSVNVQETAEPLPHQRTNQPHDTQEQEQHPKKVAVTVGLTYEAENTPAKHVKQHVVEDTLKGKPIPLMAITFPKHGANFTLRPSKLKATLESKKQVNARTSGASKDLVGEPTHISVETVDTLDHSPDNASTTQSETSKKITKRPPTPFFPRKQKSHENRPSSSTDDSQEHDLNQNDNGEKQHQPKIPKQNHKENEQQQHQQKQQKQDQTQRQLQNQPEHQQQLPSQQRGNQEGPIITPFVFQGSKERPKLKPVHRLPDKCSSELATSTAAVLQAQFTRNQPSKSPKTTRKQKPIEGDAKMEKFKLIQKNDSTASTTTTTENLDCCAMNMNDSSVTVTHCVAPWAIVCDKMPDQTISSDAPVVGKKVKCKTSKTGKTSKASHREGHGFFSKIFGKKTTTEKKKKPKHECSETVSEEMETITKHMEDLRLSSSTSIYKDDITEGKTDRQIAAITPSPLEQELGPDSESSTEESDSSTDLEPPSCLEAWEIAEDVVEKALFLLPVPTAGKYVVPDSPFEPEFVKRLVADALEAKRGLKKVKEDMKLMEKFRDALLKFFEDKEISDVIPPCNHPPGTNQCNLQPVIQPLVDILRQVLQESKVVNDQAKKEPETQQIETKREAETQQPRPRRYIKIRRKLKTGQAPTQLLIRFCQACGDTKQPDGRKLMSCGRCKDVVYCSKECQGVDWITHKFTCRGGDRRGFCKHHGT
ncbi:uncharacterized protein [Asterias amurensis]|uniref:uncharacterized protein isoform X2 n=1 Tax=Asterias amurensis TaxID=7602 RepID=UPI003AB75FEB